MQIKKEQIPWALSAGRALLGPVLILGETAGWNGAAMAWLVVTAFLSDIFDGMLARRWKCDTPSSGLLDSTADGVFYVCAGVALWVGQPQIWRDNAGLLAGVLGLEAVRYVVEFWKFGKPASYHSYLAKAWGVVLAPGLLAAFAMQRNNPVLIAALALGIVSNLEGLVMSLVLPVWQTNLKGLPAALAVRRQARGSSFEIRGKAAGPTPLGKAAAVAVLLAMVALPAFAADPAMEATYSGGTAKIVADTLGTLDTTSPAELIFRYKERGGAPSEVAIPYAKIRSFEPRNDVVRHLGFLPAVAVGLVAARQRKYTVAISYADAGDAIQIAILQTTEIEHRQLKEILRARAPESCLVTEYSSCANKPPVRPAAAPTAMAASR